MTFLRPLPARWRPPVRRGEIDQSFRWFPQPSMDIRPEDDGINMSVYGVDEPACIYQYIELRPDHAPETKRYLFVPPFWNTPKGNAFSGQSSSAPMDDWVAIIGAVDPNGPLRAWKWVGTRGHPL